MLKPSSDQSDEIKSPSVMIVEDEPIIAMCMESDLRDLGFGIFGLAQTVDAGLEMLSDNEPDFAILDYNIGSNCVTPIARVLNEKNVVFVYATGRPDSVSKNPDLPNAPIVAKPIDVKSVVQKFFSQK